MGCDMFEEERAKLQHEIKVLKSTQTELQQQLERARAAEKQLTKDKTTNLQELRHLKAENQLHIVEVKELTARLLQKQEELEAVDGGFRGKDLEIEALKREVQRLGDGLERQKDRTDGVRGQLERKRMKKQEYKKECEGLQAGKDQLQEQAAVLRGEVEHWRSKHGVAIDHLNRGDIRRVRQVKVNRRTRDALSS